MLYRMFIVFIVIVVYFSGKIKAAQNDKSSPKIYHTFPAKDIETDGSVEYRIEHLQPSKYKDALKLMTDFLIKQDPTIAAFNIAKDAGSAMYLKKYWTYVLNQHLSVACFKEGSDKVIGVNLLYVDKPGRSGFKWVKPIKIKMMQSVMEFVNFDVCDKYKVKEYMSSAGLLVHPDYRGRKIAEHLLIARKIVCENAGIQVTSTIFSADASNHIADKVGFELNASKSYQDIAKIYKQFANVSDHFLTRKSIKY
ncbi:uncharacterized protein LOC116339844 [Contarinia nasturtii]|uniref:uncharacterized protein LOC116339844 n=1 Tax=Contarinia nasturtii TaxID=265458 RepID=UPI0012D4BB37|nr:uncharacterized protein LOC116339844 [Contarinia nasturtii]